MLKLKQLLPTLEKGILVRIYWGDNSYEAHNFGEKIECEFKPFLKEEIKSIQLGYINEINIRFKEGVE